ncbi:MAG: asparaginase [Azonexus sp.]|nr:asparaginase [Azonexus sp.]
MDTPQRIHLITTGGTLDKRYHPLTGVLEVGAPVITEILAQAGIGPETYALTQCLRKDSLEINDDERAQLAAAVAASSATCIVITHGTDTMGLSAACIDARCTGKTVVLTGAMVPWQIAGSDAAFNIGAAFAAARLLPPGVYIAMHGRVLPYRNYVKDRSKGWFVAS